MIWTLLFVRNIFYANGNFNKCIEVLTEITKISKNCSDRKQSLENKIRKSLDANAKKQWDFKIKKYEDNIAAKKLDAVNNHEYVMKKMQTDATIKAKELAISVDLEKYKTQREIEFSKNNAIVEKVRLKEVGKMYSAYFNVVRNKIYQRNYYLLRIFRFSFKAICKFR